ncbi:MAG: (Fe-S)-binding protein [Promethearchaeota archaeon]
MGLFETLKKYKWMVPILTKADRKTKATLLKNAMNKKKNFYPEGEYKADVKNLINCMLCPNMCRFDCGTLQAAQKESMSPAFKARIGYYLTIGYLDPKDPANKEYIDLMYKCTNEENCKVWCPFDFSVVSLLETVREDLNSLGLMPDYVKPYIENIKNTNTIENYNIFKTYKENGIENIESDGKDEVFYYIGCEMMKFPEIVKANIKILKKLGVKFSTNLERRSCCAAPIINARELTIAKEFAQKNKELIESTSAKIIISDCPGCVYTLTHRYKELGINLKTKVMHITQYIDQLLKENKISFKETEIEDSKLVTIHDPCLLSRNLSDTYSIRNILNKIPGIKIIEPIFNKELTHCCGWSGTMHWADKELAKKEAKNRLSELKETGAKIIVSACPLCEIGLNYGLEESEKEEIKIIDVSELISKSIK